MSVYDQNLHAGTDGALEVDTSSLSKNNAMSLNAFGIPSSIIGHSVLAQCHCCGQLESAPRTFQSCRQCRQVYYCSRDCQKKQWKAGHKLECEPSPK